MPLLIKSGESRPRGAKISEQRDSFETQWKNEERGERPYFCDAKSSRRRIREHPTNFCGVLQMTPCVCDGTPGRSRTCDLQNRNLTLYPAELRVRECVGGGMSSRAKIIVVQNGGNVQRLDKCCAFRRRRGRGARAADGRDADRVDAVDFPSSRAVRLAVRSG